MPARPLKSIIVDDEQPSRDALSTYIRDYCQGVEIIAECDSVKTAYNAILQFNPQLVFLDIEMPNGNGFDLLKMFKMPGFRVIFITAFSQYAVNAFRFSAIDYLLKPVKVDELVEAVKKVREDIELKSKGQNYQTLMENLLQKDQSMNNLVISDMKGFTMVKISDIIYCDGEGYCTHFYLTGNRKVSSSKNLKYYEELFVQHPIIRVHHTCLVNMFHVKGCTRQGEILLSENMNCPLGNNYKSRFMELIGKFR